MLPSSETANELQNIEKSLLELVLETPEKGQLSRQPCAGTSEPLRLEQRQKQLPFRRFRSRGFRHLRDLQLLGHLRVEHHQPLQQVAVEVFMPNKTEPLRVGTRSSQLRQICNIGKQRAGCFSVSFSCLIFSVSFFSSGDQELSAQANMQHWQTEARRGPGLIHLYISILFFCLIF